MASLSALAPLAFVACLGSLGTSARAAAVQCHDAVEGELCYEDTVWAKGHAIHTRPHWYPGLTNASSFADFQAHLHFCFWDRCPMPCAATTQHSCTMTGRFWDGAACHDADKGSACFRQVKWAMSFGIHIHPEWYPTLSEDSTFSQFQHRLYLGQQSGMEFNDCPEPCCHDSLPGERCFEDMEWAKLYGIHDKELNHIYPPTLTNESDLAEYQAYLHLCYPGRCPEPCKATEVHANYLASGVVECPGSNETR